jgi:D-alanyl-D-alanine carboxypeptidase
VQDYSVLANDMQDDRKIAERFILNYEAEQKKYEVTKRDYFESQKRNVELVGGKTGYTYQAGHCLASACEKYGRTYIAVTGGGENKYSPIYDIMALFSEYI